MLTIIHYKIDGHVTIIHSSPSLVQIMKEEPIMFPDPTPGAHQSPSRVGIF